MKKKISPAMIGAFVLGAVAFDRDSHNGEEALMSRGIALCEQEHV